MPPENDGPHALVINAEMDASFVAWYRDVHVPEVVQVVDGYGPVTHFEMTASQPVGSAMDLRQYLTIIQIDGDPDQVFADVVALRSSGALTPPPDTGRPYQAAALFRPVGTTAR